MITWYVDDIILLVDDIFHSVPFEIRTAEIVFCEYAQSTWKLFSIYCSPRKLWGSMKTSIQRLSEFQKIWSYHSQNCKLNENGIQRLLEGSQGRNHWQIWFLTSIPELSVDVETRESFNGCPYLILESTSCFKSFFWNLGRICRFWVLQTLWSGWRWQYRIPNLIDDDPLVEKMKLKFWSLDINISK